MILDGAPNTTVKYATCCRPIPGDGVLGYLGRGEGLVVHTDDCAVARRLQNKDAERFITAVAWADGPVRNFEVGVVVTVVNSKGVLARAWPPPWPRPEPNIVHMGMTDEAAQDALDLRFVITVRDREHLDTVLRHLRRAPGRCCARRASCRRRVDSAHTPQLPGRFRAM